MKKRAKMEQGGKEYDASSILEVLLSLGNVSSPKAAAIAVKLISSTQASTIGKTDPTWAGEIDRPNRTMRWTIHVSLFACTAFTTFLAGASGWQPLVLGLDEGLWEKVALGWPDGLLYMVTVLAVLGAHESGHFFIAKWHRVPATLPFFLPVPVLLTGTLGAVMGMEGSRATRRQLFDIALAGPIAGLVIALPFLAIGLFVSQADSRGPFALPLLARWLLGILRPDLPSGSLVAPNPLFMAGWVGLLVTGLNMLPISQLDGGHVVYSLIGPTSKWIGRSLLIAAILSVVVLGAYNWIVLIVIITLIGADHPPTADDQMSLGLFRTMLGTISLLIPFLTFMPEPLLFD